jgi:hypothetical protein
VTTDPLTLITYALAGTAALFLLLAAVWWWRRDRPDAAELERRRRLQVNRVGRIAEGRIVELMDQIGVAPAEHLLAYSYRVRGVEYQAAQDISTLQDRFDFHQLAAGHPTQVKYDPHNPTNSIVLCEEWSGL